MIYINIYGRDQPLQVLEKNIINNAQMLLFKHGLAIEQI